MCLYKGCRLGAHEPVNRAGATGASRLGAVGKGKGWPRAGDLEGPVGVVVPMPSFPVELSKVKPIRRRCRNELSKKR